MASLKNTAPMFALLALSCGHPAFVLALTVSSDDSLQLVLAAPTGFHFGALSANIDGVDFGPPTVSSGDSGNFLDRAAGSATGVFSVRSALLVRQGGGLVTVHESNEVSHSLRRIGTLHVL